MMSKRLIMTCAIIGTIAGSYAPVLFGDMDIFSLWSILLGMIGGFLGIWLGVWLSKRYS